MIAAPTQLRFEHRTDDGPVLGLGEPAPRLSWVVSDADPGYVQEGYEVEVTRPGSSAEVSQVTSGEQVLVPWPSAPLTSREGVDVRVRVRGQGEWSPWSDTARVEAGLLEATDWSARFISPTEVGGIGMPAPVLSASLELPGPVSQARLYATAHGVYEASINGERVGDEVLAPGWTSYPHRLRYQTYDVTALVQEGANRLDLHLGNGWYRGRLGWGERRAVYGDRLAALAQLEVTTADGQVHVLRTDGSWEACESDILDDDLYDGQHTDLRRPAVGEPRGGVEVLEADLAQLFAPLGPPVRRTQVLPALSVSTSPSGATLIDFGQNLVGWVRLRVSGLAAGTPVVVRHAEVLEHDELGVRPLRTAKATDTYLVAGEEPVVLEPRFTFHGFRYAEVSGVPDLAPGDLEAVVLGSDLRRTGWFESSHPMLDRFHENVVWGMRGNFLDVPTDCPQRDERLGWTGDIQVFSPTASFLFDSAGFLSSWLADLAAEQGSLGGVPFVVPDVLGDGPEEPPAAAAWGDAAALVPWVVYERTGDAEVLARQLPSMRAWVDRLRTLAGPDHLWSGGFQFGDWLDPSAPPADPFAAKADPDVIATAYFARSAEVVARAAEVLGEGEVAKEYDALADKVREAFAREYVTAGGRVLSDAPTVYAQAIAWGLLPGPEQRSRAGGRLADLVRGSGFRISTGFVGTPLISDALTASGDVDTAYRLLLQTGCPSWLYAVTMGATTVWERYDSMLPDGSINPGEMTSFNHYALGAVADWMHRTVAGLAPASPGYRDILVRPIPGGGLTSASARHLTPYGEARVGWERGDGELTLTVVVPVGSTATVHVPGVGEPVRVGHGSHGWKVPDPVAAPGGMSLPAGATVRDVLDHERIWDQVVSTAVDIGVVPDGAAAAARLLPFFDMPAGELVESVAPRHFGPGLDEMHRRLDVLLTAGAQPV